ncbi:transglutaminase [Achromatium sp. WMS2]|nr:transglutaminase [Achromatium sp. WMS2]
MKYRITHITRYSYSEPVSLCHNLAHLKLRSQPTQTDINSQVRIDPLPSVSREFRDYFGNQVNYFAVQQPHQKLTITSISEVNIVPPTPITPVLDQSWETVIATLDQNLNEDVLEARLFTMDSLYIRTNTDLLDYALPSFVPERPFLECVADLMTRIYKEYTYDPNSTSIGTPLDELLINKRGVCQDFAHLAIGCIRSLGLPARYVSGYLETIPPPGVPKLQGADASHAWFSVYSPTMGWIDFDPTNNIIPNDQHITTAVGRDFSDVTPVKGVSYGGGTHSLNVSVDVERLT